MTGRRPRTLRWEECDDCGKRYLVVPRRAHLCGIGQVRASDRARLLRIERAIMDAEYEIDSTNQHVRQKGCDDVKPLSLARYTKALNSLRGAITMVRLEQGARHPTLFAGSANPTDPRRPQPQKAWGSHRPHVWKKDCQEDGEMTLKPEIELGLEADCWHCDETFTKEDACAECGFYKCPHCGKCACELDEFTRQALEKTVRAMAGRDQKELSET